MKLGQLLTVLRMRWILVISIMLIAIACAVLLNRMTEVRYSASATLFVDIKSIDPVSGQQVFAPQSIRNEMSNQAKVVTSDRVVNRVIDTLGLLDDPNEVARATSKFPSATSPRAAMVEYLLTAVRVEPSRDATTIAISVEYPDPILVAELANAFTKAYVDVALELRKEPALEYARYFEEQTSQYRDVLNKSQERLTEFQRKSGIVTSDERADVENQRLQELTTQLVAMQAAVSDSNSRSGAIGRTGAGSLAEVVQNPLIQALRGDVNRASAELQNLGATLGPSHPKYQSAKAQLSELQSRLAVETDRIGASVRTSNQVNQRRLNDIQVALEAQRQKVLRLKKDRDEIAALKREVDSAQKAYDVVAERARQKRLESQARQSDVSVLTPAVAATDPTQPKAALNLGIGGVLGLLLGAAVALIRETSQKPLRNSSDLLDSVGLAVLAVLPRADSTRPQRLIGDTGPVIRAHAMDRPLRLK